MANALLILAFSYLLGSLPAALIAGRLAKGIDIRNQGSGNLGTTNAFRILGWKLGVLVGLVDLAKGFAATSVIASLRLLPGSSLDSRLAFGLATAAVMLGHVKPVFAQFRGGKAVAVAAGAITAAYPLPALACLLVFIPCLLLSGYVALASSAAALMLPLGYALIQLLAARPIDWPIEAFFCVAAAVVIFLHRGRLRLYASGKAELFSLFGKPRS